MKYRLFINTNDFHYQREVGGWDWKLWNFTYKYGADNILGGGGPVDNIEYIDINNVLTNMASMLYLPFI